MSDQGFRDHERRISNIEQRNRAVSPMGYPAGSAFPTGISDGYLFYRTDAQQLCRYNSTNSRWYPEEGVGGLISRHMTIPNLRAFWPMNSYATNVNDVSGSGKGLGNTAGSFSVYGSRVPYWEFNGSTAYLSRADDTELDITGRICFGGWFWHDTIAATQTLMSKWDTGGNQRSYGMQMLDGAPDTWRVFVSNLGTDTVALASTATVTASAWHHIVGRFTPSTELTIFVDGVKTTTASSIPASIFNGTADFRIGSLHGTLQPFDGRASMCFLSVAGQENMPDEHIIELYNKTKLWYY